jgi:hypothetical protein
MKLAWLALVCVVGGTRVAHGDARADVEAVVQAHVKSVGAPAIAGMTADGLIIVDSERIEPKYGDNFRSWVSGGNFSDNASLKLGALTVVVDEAAKTGWFHAPATLKFKEYVGEGIDAWAKPRPLRINGIVVNDGGWKIVRVVYTSTITDKDLVESAAYEKPLLAPVTAAPKHVTDNALAKAADTWFANGGGAGFVKGASASGKLVANGTSATEFAASAAAALKVAKGWDKLKLGAESIEAAMFGDGKIGLVIAKVRLPTKTGKAMLAVSMTLYAIAVEEGDSGWKWQSINWAH